MTNRVRTARIVLLVLGLLVLGGAAALVHLALSPGSGTSAAPSPAASSSAATTAPPSAATSAAAATASPSSPAAATSGTVTPNGPLSSEPTTPAQKLAVEAARIMTTWDPAKDLDETASEGRAKKLMTPERAKQVIISDRGTSDPQWTDAAAEGWTSEPTVTLVPSDAANVIRVNATWDWVSPTGEREPGDTRRSFAFEMTTEKTPRISDYTWSNLG